MKKQFIPIIFLLAALVQWSGLQAQNTLCTGEEVCLTIVVRGDIQWQSSPDSIVWADETGAIQDTFCLVPTQTAVYRAYVIEGTCDTIWSDPVWVQVNPQPVADAGADQNSCFGSTITLGGNPAASGGTAPYMYVWTPAAGLSNPNVANPTATLSGPSQYILTVTDSLGCTDMDTTVLDTSGVFVGGMMMFSYTGQIDTFIVPACVDSLTIEAWGAQGGGGVVAQGQGGKGARLKGDFAVNPGDTILVLVGQVGQTAYGYGGGGGSFVVLLDTTPLVVAGGGGGAEHNDNFPGFDAVLTTSGMNVENGLGGTNGMGGELGNPNTSGCGWSGSGGGGLLGNGGLSGDGGGFAFVNGGNGGTDPTGNCVVAGFGGFGGGGAGGNPGGGGGGYSGGAGGANIGLVPNRGGGGGGSFNSGANPSNTAGVQSGNGQVEIIW
jgi:hypothetical protein